ncbi:uncharacterized protein PV07_05821 [Cladophialophora immunda]|uniref:Intradiol ring-cleavage dioxygenases domain-containing protein n=1 Tax=Cladophialophora immunda TaxID=569365 RepID=A0A0D2AXP3_9EURO|nr:uncharacterized protein PV07_05821 [Cladophialophora immunda]KIW30042.1 hypothetical protein PV07_05821 [Cladophialophora immunda]OQV06212.1 hypothetical protein CLAIMM_10817 [Cladophialophora immunda]
MNGENKTGASRYDPNFTQNVINAMGPKTSPRMREVMTSLIKHLHDFAREIDLTVDEWAEGVQLLNWAGQMSNDRRNEGQLVCDVVGLETLVDEITYKKAAEAADLATQSAILGPFFQTDHTIRKKGDSISANTPEDAEVVYLYGQVTDATTKKPLANASVDVWQASTNGLYEQQDEKQPKSNLCGKFYTDENGEYGFYCLRPTPYPIPYDGPAGKLLQLLDRHPYRPAHIHFIVLAEGFKPITTQIFDKDSKYLDDDSVFAVKDSLIVEFVPRKSDEKAKKELRYDIKMAPLSSKGESGEALVTTGMGRGF